MTIDMYSDALIDILRRLAIVEARIIAIEEMGTYGYRLTFDRKTGWSTNYNGAHVDPVCLNELGLRVRYGPSPRALGGEQNDCQDSATVEGSPPRAARR